MLMHDDALNQNIPHHWSVDQALAVADFLECLAAQIWSRYGPALRTGWTDAPAHPPQQLALPFPPPWWDHDQDDIPCDPDDDIPW
jgi:hypothetical protein